MKSTLKVLIGAVACVLMGYGSALAQTGSLQGRQLFLYDGGIGVNLNRIGLVTPIDATLTSNYTLTLPPNDGNANDIIYTPDGTGTLQFTDGNGLFWRLLGNTTTTPWSGIVGGNFVGTADAQNLVLLAGGTVGGVNMQFWTNNSQRMMLDNNGNLGLGIAPSGSYRMSVDGVGTYGGIRTATNVAGGHGLYSTSNGAGGIGLVSDAVGVGLAVGPTTVPVGGIEIDATGVGILIRKNQVAGPGVGIAIDNSPVAVQISNANTAIDARGNALIDGDLQVWDQGGGTATNNSTILTVRSGSAQGTNNLVSVVDGAASNIANISKPAATSARLQIGSAANNASLLMYNGVGGGQALVDIDATLAANRTYTIPTIEANGTAVVAVGQGTANQILLSNGTGNRAVWAGAGIAEQGVTYINEGGVTRFRLGGLGVDINSITTSRNVTVGAAGTLTFNTAAGANNMLVLNNNGNVAISSSGGGTTNIGHLAGAAVGVRANADVTIDVNATTNNVVLNNILSAVPVDDMLWITAANQVRRTGLTGTANEGIQFNNSAYRLGHLVDGNNPVLNPRFVRVGAGGTLTFNTAGNTMLALNNTGNVGISTTGAGTTTIGSAAAGAISAQSVSTIGLTAGTIASIASTTTNINTVSGNVSIGNGGGTFQLTSNQLNVTTAGDISDAGGNVIVADNLDVTGTGTNNIGVAATTNLVLGSTTVTGITNINNVASPFATTIGNVGNTGAVGISANNNITVDVAATTNNLVLNNILSAVAVDDMMWITAANQVRRTSLTGLANEGLQFNNSAFRLGHLVDGNNPILNPRFVRVGAGGTLTFNTAGNTMLALNNTGNVGISTTGAGTTTIGSAAAGAISAQSVSTIGLTAGTIASIASTTTNINTVSGNVSIGNGGGTFQLTSNQLNVTTAGDISDAGGNVIVADNLDVTGTGTNNIGVAATTNLVLGTTTVTGATTINNVGGPFSTTIGSTANAGAIGIRANNDITVDVAATTNNLVLNNLLSLAPVEDMLWITATNQVRRTPFNGTAREGLVFSASAYRLGTTTQGNLAADNAFLANRYINLDNFTLGVNRGVGADLMLTLNGATDAITLDAAAVTVLGSTATNINVTGTGPTAIGSGTAGTFSAQSATTVGLTAGTTASIASATTNINTGTGNVSVGNNAGTFQLASDQLRVATSGNISDNGGDVIIDDAVVINSAGAADLTISEGGLDRGANLITVGATGGTLTLAGVSGTPNVTATSLASNGGVAFNPANDGIVVASNPNGQLRRRPVSEFILANQGLQYNESGTDNEVRLGHGTAQTGNPVTSNRFVNVNNGVALTFARGAAAENMLVLNGNGNVQISPSGAGTLALGNVATPFSLTSTTVNVATGTGDISNAAFGAAVTVNDAQGLVVNSGAGVDLSILETTISRAGNIAINPGLGNTVTSDGGLNVAQTGVFGTGLTVTTGNATVSSGTLSVTGGNIVATSGDITSSAGNITATVGSLNSGGGAGISGTTNINAALGGITNIGTGSNTGNITIGNIVGPNTTRFQSAAIEMANIPAYTAGNVFITRNASNQLEARTIANVLTGTGTNGRIARFTPSGTQLGDASLDDDGAGALSRTGTVSLTTTGNNITLNPGAANIISSNGGLDVAQSGTFGTGLTVTSGGATVTAGGLTVTAGGAGITGTTNINTSGAFATNIGTGTNTGTVTIGNQGNPANTTVLDARTTQVNGNATLASATTDNVRINGNLRVSNANNQYAERVLITGNGVAQTFQINNTLVAANSVILVTVETSSAGAIYSAVTETRVAGTSFNVRLSGVPLNLETIQVSYMIINPQ